TVDVTVVGNDTATDARRQLFLGNTKGRLHLAEGVVEVLSVNLHIHNIITDTGDRANFHMTIEGERGRRLDKASYFGSREIFGETCKLRKVNVTLHDLVI